MHRQMFLRGIILLLPATQTHLDICARIPKAPKFSTILGISDAQYIISARHIHSLSRLCHPIACTRINWPKKYTPQLSLAFTPSRRLVQPALYIHFTCYRAFRSFELIPFPRQSMSIQTHLWSCNLCVINVQSRLLTTYRNKTIQLACM